MRFRRAALAAVALAAVPVGAAAQDVARGQMLFEACQSCHSLDPARTGMAGPHLAGLKGRIVGSANDFDYSPALQSAKAQRLTWDEVRLKAYLADPDTMFRGGWMSPSGLDAEADRAAVAAFLLRER